MAKAKSARKSAAKARKKGGAKRGAKKRAGGPRKRTRKSPRKAAQRKRRKAKPAAKADEGLLTLTEVSKRTGISMPTLQRYKKEHQNRLATVGEGRTQRFKPESVAVFEQIKKENIGRRGRPRKAAAKKKPAKRARARRSGTPEGLISLSEIGRRTGISYPTLLRYVRLYGDRIPSHGTGRKRRFPPEAVPVFRELRQQSRRGRRRGGAGASPAAAAGRGVSARLRSLERRQAKLDKQMQKLLKALKKPLVKKL